MVEPERVKSIVVADIAPVNYTDNNTNIINILHELSNVNIKDRKMADSFLSKRGIELSVRAFLLKNLRRNTTGNFELKININAIKANYESHLSVAPQGEVFNAPCLFLKGENSDYIDQKHLPIIQSLFPQSSLHTVENVGHWLHAEKPELFNQLVLEFISEIS
jgi:esterase